MTTLLTCVACDLVIKQSFYLLYAVHHRLDGMVEVPESEDHPVSRICVSCGKIVLFAWEQEWAYEARCREPAYALVPARARDPRDYERGISLVDWIEQVREILPWSRSVTRSCLIDTFGTPVEYLHINAITARQEEARRLFAQRQWRQRLLERRLRMRRR